jgi:hypothetical protein
LHRTGGVDAVLANMTWQPNSACSCVSPGTGRAKKGDKLKRLLKNKLKNEPPSHQQFSDDDNEILTPLHFLDAKHEVTRKKAPGTNKKSEQTG